MTISDRLDQIEARANAATEGPWITGGSIEEGVTRFGTLKDPDDPSEPGVLLGDVAYGSNAEFIAHARTDVPALTAAIRAVLDLHKREWWSEGSFREGVACEACSTAHNFYVDYPCPTAVAIEAALGEVAP